MQRGKTGDTGEPRYIEAAISENQEPPRFFVVLYIVCIALGGLGDLKRINGGIGMYMKAFSLGAFGLALIWLFKTGRLDNLRGIGAFARLFFAPLILTLAISLMIWCVKMENVGSITRGLSKMMFQCINILSVLSAAYLFGKKAINYYILGLIGANALIALIEMASYGPVASVQSVIDGLLSGGEAKGYMRAIEISDITFAMGLLALYLAAVNHKNKKNWLLLFTVLFFFILGYKRIAILGLAFSLIIWFILDKRRLKTRIFFVSAISVLIVLLCFGYIVSIKSGLFTAVMDALGVNTMGRNNIYAYINTFYEIDITFMGYGFEYFINMMRTALATGNEVIGVTAIHNDILKQYLDLGFWGFFAWVLFIYVYQPRWYFKHFGERAARLMLALNIYTVITYMTDNTIYYYWLSMSLRIIMVSYTMSDNVQEALRSDELESNYVTKDELLAFDDERT